MNDLDLIEEIIIPKVDELKRLGLFGQVVRNGIQTSADAVSYIDINRRINVALKRPDPYFDEEAVQASKRAVEPLQNFAVGERDNDFTFLNGVLVVRLWTLLEATVDELVTAGFKHHLPGRDAVALGKLKGPLIDFTKASEAEQAALLTELLKAAVDAPLKAGIGRFEAILSPVGLAGPVVEPVRKAMFELSQLRNVMVHKNGVVDRSFVTACPWYGGSIGDSVTISSQRVVAYWDVVGWYFSELMRRCSVALDKPGADGLHLLQDELNISVEARLTSLGVINRNGG